MKLQFAFILSKGRVGTHAPSGYRIRKESVQWMRENGLINSDIRILVTCYPVHMI